MTAFYGTPFLPVSSWNFEELILPGLTNQLRPHRLINIIIERTMFE
jgi:hypothetical protein